MNHFSAVHPAARLLAAASMLCLSLTTSAVELTGKPVAVGKPVTGDAAASVAASKPAAASATTSSSVVTKSAQAAVDAVQTVKALAHEADSAAEASSDMAQDLSQDTPQGTSQDQDTFHDDDATTEPDTNPFDNGHMFERHSNWDSPDLLVPVVAMGLLFGGPVILVIVLTFFYYRAKSQRQHNLNANIDKLLAAGRDIPIELLLGEEPPLIKASQPQSSGQVVYSGSDEMLYKGVRNIGLGIGLLLFLTIMFSFKIGSSGFILIGLGLSRMVIWYLSGTRRHGAVKVED